MKSLIFIKNELVYFDESGQEDDNLPVPVYTHIRPDMGHQFILHFLFLLGKFETEVYLTMNRTPGDTLCYTKLIVLDDDKESLKQYSTSLLRIFIEEKLMHFPNLFRDIYSFIINDAHIFDYLIINDSITITDMPQM